MKLFLLSLAFLAIGTSISTGEPINVTLHYRAYCIYCKKFISEQLLPVYDLLGDDVLNMEIVPDSKDTYDDDGNLAPTCYSGEDECTAETYQSCILAGAYTQSQKIKFLGCIEAASDAAVAEDIVKCTEQSDINWDDIKECYSNGKGYEALTKFNIIQHSYDTVIEHVPFVMYNGVVDYDVDENARSAFLITTCSFLEEKPSACST